MNHTTLIDEFHYIKVIMIFVLGLSWLISTRLLVRYFKKIYMVNANTNSIFNNILFLFTK